MTQTQCLNRLQIVSTLIPALFVATCMLLLKPAFADRDIAGFRESQMSMKNSEANSVRITGELMCTLAAENSGQACDLKIKENGTARIYGIADTTVAANALKRLYFNGARTVTIEGTLSNNGYIAVASTVAN